MVAYYGGGEVVSFAEDDSFLVFVVFADGLLSFHGEVQCFSESI